MTVLVLNGHRSSVEVQGAGESVVLVHGLGGTAAQIWKGQIADLAARYKVVSYDLRGSGSSEVTEGPYDIELLTVDLRALIEALELESVALVAHSMGGSIALAYAASYPDDVRALVGIGAPVRLPDAARVAMEARAETVEADGMSAVAATVAQNGVSPTFREERTAEFEELVAMLAANDPRGYAAQCRALVGLDLGARLGLITAPVLLVSGDHDGVSPPAVTEANAALVRDGRFELVEDCGHNLTLEKPEALARSAWPFLNV